MDSRGPSQRETEIALSELEQELRSNEMSDIVSLNPLLTEQLVEQMVAAVKNQVVQTRDARFEIQIGGRIKVLLYLGEDMSPFEPYLIVDAAQPTDIIVIVNTMHPHWNQLQGVRERLTICGIVSMMALRNGVRESSLRQSIQIP